MHLASLASPYGVVVDFGMVLDQWNPRSQQLTPTLTLPQVHDGLSVLLLEVDCRPGTDYICCQVQRQLLRNESARFYHHRTRKYIPLRKLRRETQ